MPDIDLFEIARGLAALLLILIPVALALVTIRAHMAEEDERAIRDADDDLHEIGTPMAPQPYPGEAWDDWKRRRDAAHQAKSIPAMHFTPD
ncbi:MAG: hypothetical protein JSS57_04445 [Proteobacteria bacterium]|nr:hypothetical protein [Pseudomonadota bacterium]